MQGRPYRQPTVSPRAEGAFTIGYLDNDFGTVSLRVGFLRHRDATLRVLEQSGLRGRWLSRLDDMPPHKGSLDYRFESALGYVPFLAVGLRRGSLGEPFFSRGYPLRLDPASVVTVVGPGSNVTGSLYRLPFPIPGNIADVDLLVQPFFVIQQPPFLGGDLYEMRIR